jgi:acyl-coenzyme A synthetase/AMP-(fatty) acid ligase
MGTWYNVATHTRRHAEERPDQPALLFPAKAYTDAAPAWDALTYRDFERRSDAYAYGLAERGVKRGDRVLMLMKPELDLWVVLFALFKIGAVPVIMDPGMGPKRLLACIERIGCRVIIAIPPVHVIKTFVRKPFKAAEICITVGRRLWWGGHKLSECLSFRDEPFPLAELAFDDGAAIAFTSGSTGTPKGVAYHQGMWDTAVDAIREMMHMKAGDVSVQAFAAFAIYDLCWGHTAVIPKMDLSKPAKADPAVFAAAIQHNNAQMAFASPIIWRKLAPYCTERGLKLHSLDKAITTGAPTPPEMVRAFADILRDGVEFHTPYGATEAIPVSHIGSDELLGSCVQQTAKGAGTCVGRPAPGLELAIIEVTDANLPIWTDDLRVPDGTIGELVVAGGQVSQRYEESPEGNASAKIQDGDRVRHRMGDLGYLDADGRIWFCGRKSHRLQTAEGMVPSVPVEGIYNEHPAVFRSALVGVGTAGSQVPVLCVELHPGHTLSGIEGELKALADGTPYAGVVQRFLAHPGFPTDARHNSKIRRGDLKTWAEGQGLV